MLGLVQNSSGSGLVSGQSLGSGFIGFANFPQCSGSGLSGFISEVQVLGFIGFGF